MNIGSHNPARMCLSDTEALKLRIGPGLQLIKFVDSHHLNYFRNPSARSFKCCTEINTNKQTDQKCIPSIKNCA